MRIKILREISGGGGIKIRPEYGAKTVASDYRPIGLDRGNHVTRCRVVEVAGSQKANPRRQESGWRLEAQVRRSR